MSATPFTSDTAETWGLEQPAINAARLAEVLLEKPRVVWRRARWSKDNLTLYRCGGADDGSFAVVDDDLAVPSIDHYCRFRPIHIPQLGRPAIELRTWRSNLLSLISISREIMLERLLHAHGAIVSCQDLTANGADHLWSRQMAGAADAGMTVGFIDEAGEVTQCNDPENFHLWYGKHLRPCGPVPRARFFILANERAYASPSPYETVNPPVECRRGLLVKPYKRHPDPNIGRELRA